ncbi:hypothetical protein QJS10_CPB13g01071 [Acorus calamus]|uniref:N-acetyltransferase domain-containing protein n=1 Tax=Acorus calamus TaxID=4465 RepID=A0AAV9DH73_ACOCL|nr:hypothetical protein QJS10_CPB13g01071 [Acorus calamus]
MEKWEVVEMDWRKSSCCDVEEIVRLERKIFPKHESLSESLIRELKKRNSGLIFAKRGEEIAGYITKLAVKEEYRGQGLGEALLNAAIQKCRTRKIQRVCLHVDPLRTPAVSLYNKLGFQIDHLIEGYYSSDRNAYRMYLDFDV